ERTEKTPTAADDREQPLFRSPLARKLARDNDIDLAAVTGTGPGGRIVRADVQEAIEAGAARRRPAGPEPSAAEGPAPTAAAPAPGSRPRALAAAPPGRMSRRPSRPAPPAGGPPSPSRAPSRAPRPPPGSRSPPRPVRTTTRCGSTPISGSPGSASPR